MVEYILPLYLNEYLYKYSFIAVLSSAINYYYCLTLSLSTAKDEVFNSERSTRPHYMEVFYDTNTL